MSTDVGVVTSLYAIIDKPHFVRLFAWCRRKNSVVLGAFILPPGAATGAERTAWYIHLYIK